MTRISATAAAALLAIGSLAATAGSASAHHHSHDYWVAGGVGLATGLILGGVLAAQPAPVYVQPAPAVGPHVRWCASRYRSYDPSSNTWIDRYGRVRLCASPYGY